jgi:DNA-binding beta-propeller fold protein YncE
MVALPGGQRAYRAEGGAYAVSVLDSRTGAVLKTIPTAFRVDLLALSEDNRWLYGMSPRAEAIVVIDLVSDQVVGTILTRPPAPPAVDGL